MSRSKGSKNNRRKRKSRKRKSKAHKKEARCKGGKKNKNISSKKTYPLGYIDHICSEDSK